MDTNLLHSSFSFFLSFALVDLKSYVLGIEKKFCCLPALLF